MFMGAAKNASNEGVMCLTSVDNLATAVDSGKYQRTDRCIAFLTEGQGSTATVDAEVEYTSTLTTGTGGFRLNILSAPSNINPVFYLAIKGGSWNVSSFTEPTTNGANTVTVPFAHTPKGLFTWGAAKTAGTTVVADLDYTLGAAQSSTARFNNLGRDNDNATINNSARGGSVTATPSIIKVLTGASNALTVPSTSDFTSFAANQFTLTWTTDAIARQHLYFTVGDNVGAALVNVVNDTVGITEGTPIIKNVGKTRNINEIVGLTEPATVVKSLGKTRTINDILGITEPASIVKVTKKAMVINETVGLVETLNEAMVRRRTINEILGLLEGPTVRKITAPTITTLSAVALQLRFSGGTTNSVTTASRGGAMSNVSVTDNTINNTWDDITSSQALSGLTEYRCYYVYNAHATSTAYGCEVWIDTTTPAADSIEIGIGSAAMGGTEQGPLAAETTAPSAVVFSEAPDVNSSISLGNIPPLTGRSIWIKRIVPAGTASWNDNQYILRMLFFSDYISGGGAGSTPGFTGSGFLTQGFFI